jgi:uncharacterized protein (DUF305 family)
MKHLLFLSATLLLGATPASGQSKPYSSPDSLFMSGMIGHHAQAITMAGLVPARGASQPVRILADRIIVSQRDEIDAMRVWLGQHGLPVPDSSHHHVTHGPGAMPGMLSPAQMKELEGAQGADFDRLFVTLMIQHHQGALAMVDQLRKSPGSGQDSFVNRFASDVYADQNAEIERMARLLVTLPLAGRSP